MVITVRKEESVAVFTWNNELTECCCDAVGFTPSQIDDLIAMKLHEGADVAGYEVEIA